MEELSIENKNSKKLSKIISNEKNIFKDIDINSLNLYEFEFLLFFSDLKNQKNKQNPENNILNFLENSQEDFNSNANTSFNSVSALAEKEKINSKKLDLLSLFEISLKFKELLNKKKNLILSYSIKDKLTNETLQNLNFLNLTLNTNPLNYKNLKDIIKDISTVEIFIEKINNTNNNNNNSDPFGFALDNLSNNYTSFVSIRIKMKDLFSHLDINSFEIYVQDDDCEFDWLGTKRYKVKNENSFIVDGRINNSNKKNINNNNIPEKIRIFEFNFSSEKKGLLNMNKINININPVSISDKNIIINNIPNLLIIEL
jgi:hypothetical protein